ncbi:hypothetical protein BT63DRAFT_49547 [Microthyrium microscopicum]|uniref:Uncharacterized protein n=1 Tax=Microthyrium microscopicum TaxID=703497 RepID=A0A6A6U1B2_9PEZI|nr:hypothetical protein BT63DRAFT_49547 [Microthyrium microscopicum]
MHFNLSIIALLLAPLVVVAKPITEDGTVSLVNQTANGWREDCDNERRRYRHERHRDCERWEREWHEKCIRCGHDGCHREGHSHSECF